MGKNYDDDDDDIIKTVLEHTNTTISGGDNNTFHYDHIPETRSEPTPKPTPETPKDDD